MTLIACAEEPFSILRATVVELDLLGVWLVERQLVSILPALQFLDDLQQRLVRFEILESVGQSSNRQGFNSSIPVCAASSAAMRRRSSSERLA